MTEFVLSIDPGLSTGVALLSYEEDSPAQLVEGWQFTGGVPGLLDWIRSNWSQEDHPEFGDWTPAGMWFEGKSAVVSDWEYLPSLGGGAFADEFVHVTANLTVTAEKFTARNTQGFSYTTASLEPLRGEGALIALGLMPDYTVAEKRWRDPALQYFAGGSGKAEKKKRQHAFLKANGFYRTGKDFGTPDADDYRSAASHGIVYVARELKHKPTFEWLAQGVEEL